MATHRPPTHTGRWTRSNKRAPVSNRGKDRARKGMATKAERAVIDNIEHRLPLGETLVEAKVFDHLPIPTLHALLEARSIPHADCVQKNDLVVRIEQSPKGSCLGLPARVLKQMLRNYGYACEIDMHVDKHELARQVMVGRAFDRARRAAEEQQRVQHAQRSDADLMRPAGGPTRAHSPASVSPASWVQPSRAQPVQGVDDEHHSPCCMCAVQ